ncbi:MAG: hypothetical protein HYT69_00515 [Candidatus Zambryskibacteria bacterium]|nr:hypothetical protein [Candidatus Zambryskibacteria bacterium]
MRSALACILVLVLFPAVFSGQGQAGIDLKNHPEFSAEKIQSQFVLGRWVMKRSRFEKRGGQMYCNNELFAYGQKIFIWDDSVFCGRMAQVFGEVLNGGIVTIVVFSMGQSLQNPSSLKDNLVQIPQENLVVVGFRDVADFLALRPSNNDQVNMVVSEIYSLSLGRVMDLLGEALAD